MKIAFVSHSFAEYCIRHANVMANEHDVLLILPANIAEEHVSLVDPRVRYEPFPGMRYRQPLRQLRTMIRVVRQVRAYKPDVVHFQNGHPFFNFALPLLKKFPLVITIHDPRQHLGDRESRLTPQFVMDYGFKQADRVIVHGTDLKQVVVNELGIKDCQVDIIPHVAIGERAIDTTLKDDGNTVLFFGRIWEYKGLDYLIQAEPKISAEFPDVRIVVAGRGEDFARYRRKMVHPERFEVYNNWITEDRRAQIFATASVVVLPYVEASQSGVIPVAYTYEKPVIATRVGGLPDMVEHGRTGLLVQPRDSDALADAVIELLRDRQKRIAMGRAGKEKLERECAPEVVTQQTLAVYRETIQDFHARTGRPVVAEAVAGEPANREVETDAHADLLVKDAECTVASAGQTNGRGA